MSWHCLRLHESPLAEPEARPWGSHEDRKFLGSPEATSCLARATEHSAADLSGAMRHTMRATLTSRVAPRGATS